MIAESRFFCLLIVAMVFTGCNNDIFIKPVPQIEDIVLDGHGDMAKFSVNKRELKGFNIDCPFWAGNCNVFFYDKDGNEHQGVIDINEVTKITFTTPCCAIDFLIDGNEVTVVALDNTSSQNIELWVTLDYGGTVSGFGIVITPGDAMVLDNMSYGMNPIQTDLQLFNGPRRSLTNNTPVTQQLTIQPYFGATSTVLYESSDNWETGVAGFVPVLYYSDGEWIWPPEPNAHIEIGNRSAYTPYGIDLDKTISIDVPPFSKTSVEVTVTYATCLTAYSCELIMPGSGIGNMSWGTCQIRQPIDYKITEVCEKL